MYTYEKKSKEEILQKHYEQAINSNIKLIDENKILLKENEGLKLIIDEAIKYVKKNYPVCAGSELLNILKGKIK